MSTPTAPSAPLPPADVSVVIPSGNGVTRGYIFSCLDSVLRQTRPVKRVLVVIDDFTTDDTAAQVRARYPGVEVLVKPGRGLAAARNHALRSVDTEYVAMLDDDDEFLPAKIERLTGYLAANPDAVMVFSRMQMIDALGQQTGEAGSSAVGLTYPQCLLGNDFMPPSAAVCRTKALVQAGLFDESCRECEDYELFIRLARLGRIAYVDEALIRYRHHAGQMSRGLLRLDEVALRVVTAHARAGLPARADAIIRFYCYGAAVRALTRRDLGGARAMLRRAPRPFAPAAFLARAVGILLAPLPALKRPYRRWEQRRVLGAGLGSAYGQPGTKPKS